MMLQVRACSEPDADDELLSVVVAKGGRKLVAGSGAGVLNLFSWGHFEDCSDRFPGAYLGLWTFLSSSCMGYVLESSARNYLGVL